MDEQQESGGESFSEHEEVAMPILVSELPPVEAMVVPSRAAPTIARPYKEVED